MQRSFVVLVLFIVSLSVVAESLIIGRGNGEYPPYEWSEGTAYHGLHIELVKKAAEALGVVIEIKSFPWPRALIEIEKGRIDALTFVGKSEDRSRYIRFIDGNILSQSRFTLFRKQHSKAFRFDGDLDALSGMTIGVQSGYSYGDAFDKSPSFSRKSLRTYQQMLDLVLLGRIDFGLVNETEFKYSLRKQQSIHQIEFIFPPLSVNSSYLGFTKAKNNEILAQGFAREIKRIAASPEYLARVKSFLSE